MNKARKQNLLSLLLCAVLIAAMALSMMGCNDKSDDIPAGTVTFTLTVTDKNGTTTTHTVTTDKATVGDALLAEGLITGEEGQYGLYVKTVNGITADYETDGTYWAFYVNGEYASSGVDKTKPQEGAVYAFKETRG